jgi:RNA polymerase sigma-70 factor (ECF subfamily)
LPDEQQIARFERLLLPHLDAAYNLARWLTRDEHDAADIVQEAYLRAHQYFGRFHGEDGRMWLLKIVRNTGYTWLKRNRPAEIVSLADEKLQTVDGGVPPPEAHASAEERRQLLYEAIGELPVEYREVLVLRELEGLSYKEISTIADIPMGTVMSRLSRAREKLQERLAGVLGGES